MKYFFITILFFVYWLQIALVYADSKCPSRFDHCPKYEKENRPCYVRPEESCNESGVRVMSYQPYNYDTQDIEMKKEMVAAKKTDDEAERQVRNSNLGGWIKSSNRNLSFSHHSSCTAPKTDLLPCKDKENNKKPIHFGYKIEVDQITGETRAITPTEIYEDEWAFLPKLAPLAPDHTGHSLTNQPKLYWYISNYTPTLKFSITEENNKEITASSDVPIPEGTNGFGQGIYFFYLNQLDDFKLKPNTKYEWRVFSDDFDEPDIAAGVIKYIKLDNADNSVDSFSRNGFWYDAINAVKLDDEKENTLALLQQIQMALEVVTFLEQY